MISQHALLTLCTQFKLGELAQTHIMKGALSPSSYSSLLDSDLRPGGPYPHPHDSSDHEDDYWWDSRPASWHGSSTRQDHAGANVLGSRVHSPHGKTVLVTAVLYVDPRPRISWIFSDCGTAPLRRKFAVGNWRGALENLVNLGVL